MLLMNGKDVNVVGQINVDQQPHLIVKLTSPVYINDELISLIVMPASSFQDHVRQRAASTLEVVPDAVGG